MRVFVITGDKRETAIEIGYSSKLLKEEQSLVIIDCQDADYPSQECERQLYQAIQTVQKEQFGLVIDGESLRYALHEHVAIFLRLLNMAHSVLCCRVTPLQKVSFFADCLRVPIRPTLFE